MPAFRLIVGLGNPGREYRDTRHNAGFMLLDRLAQREGVGFRSEKSWHADITRSGSVLFCKPTTYMNGSGKAVQALSLFYKITPAEMLVVVDDMALPLGKLRLRPNGSSGGHNGLQSIIDHAGTRDFPRLRIGIGDKNAPGAAVNHVLGQFAPDEQAELEGCLCRAIDAVDCAQSKGLEAAMNSFN